MADWLEQAQQHYQGGNHQRALLTLSSLTQLYDLTEAQAEEALGLATAIHEASNKGRVHDRCQKVISDLRLVIARHQNDPCCVAAVRDCIVLGGGGLPPRVGETWDIDFDTDELQLLKRARDPVSLPYYAVTALEIGGPGKKTEGGGFIGGGFGLEGAAEGMLIASALNLVTTRTSITTVICIQTAEAELHMLNSEETPDALRMRLSPVFVRLRREANKPPTHAKPPAPSDEDVIDRLHKLAEPLEKGLVTEDELGILKARLLASAIGDGDGGAAS